MGGPVVWSLVADQPGCAASDLIDDPVHAAGGRARARTSGWRASTARRPTSGSSAACPRGCRTQCVHPVRAARQRHDARVHPALERVEQRPGQRECPRWLVPNWSSKPSTVSRRGVAITPALLISRSISAWRSRTRSANDGPTPGSPGRAARARPRRRARAPRRRGPPPPFPRSARHPDARACARELRAVTKAEAAVGACDDRQAAALIRNVGSCPLDAHRKPEFNRLPRRGSGIHSLRDPLGGLSERQGHRRNADRRRLLARPRAACRRQRGGRRGVREAVLPLGAARGTRRTRRPGPVLRARCGPARLRAPAPARPEPGCASTTPSSRLTAGARPTPRSRS